MSPNPRAGTGRAPRRRAARRPAAWAAAAALALVAALGGSSTATAAEPDVVQPQDVTVLPGQQASFTVEAPGASIFQWYRLPNTTSAVKTDFSTPGASTYAFTATEDDDGAQFIVKFLLGGAFVSSRTATLTVGTGEAQVTTQPLPATAFETRPVRFSVTAKGTSPLEYRWQRSADEGSTWTDVAGADSATLELVADLADDGALFRAVVDNPVGAPAMSEPGRLTVLPLTGDAEPVEHASLSWGLNTIYQGGNPAGNSCNTFSAGTQPEFADRQGDVQIVHLDADGNAVSVSAGTACQGAEGSVDHLNQRVLFTEGTGTANVTTGEATVRWTGAFTANAYGGLVPWWLQDPTLTVHSDGSGTLTATAGGEGASMDDPENPYDVAPREVTVATFRDVQVTADGIVVQPDYAGVDYFPLVDGVRSTTSAIPAAVKAGDPQWGSWPESFVDFQYETQLSSYWHTSGLSADPDKPPYPFEVRFASAPDVANVPAIVANPSTTTATPFVEGRDVAFTATVQDATQVQWQRSTSPSGPWTDVPGATTQTFTIAAIDSSWNNTYLRLLATNDEGSAASGAVRLTTRGYQELAFTVQPSDVLTIAGYRAVLQARATGNPAPLSGGYGVQISRDGGATWSDLPDVQFSTSGLTTGDTFTVPTVAAADDGALLRAVARNADGETATSAPARLTVAPATGAPQLVVSPADGVDPAAATTLTVVGAGFVIPDAPAGSGYSLDLGLFDTTTWQPGQTGTRAWVVTSSQTSSGQLYQGALASRAGWFTAQIKVPAGRLDPTRRYGVGSFLRLTDNSTWVDTFDDRAGDAWAPVLLTGQSPASSEGIDVTVDVPADTDPGPGVLAWTIAGGDDAVSLGTAERLGTGVAASGALRTITVTDTRVDAPAWSLTGRAGDFRAQDGDGSFGGEALGWTPTVLSDEMGTVRGSDVAPGSGAGLTASSALASAATGHQRGTAEVSAGLSLLAPSDTPAGRYTATLTLTMLG